MSRPSSWLRLSQEPLLFGASVLVLVVLQGAPLVALVIEALRSAELALVASPRLWWLFTITLARAAAIAAGAVAIGLPVGLLLGRCAVPMPRALLALHAFPAFLPPFLIALGWFHLLGVRGLAGSETTSRWLFTDVGAVVVLVLALAPIVTVLVALASAGIDPSIEEAARLSARAPRVIGRILVPLVASAAALGALLVFALAFAELGVPMFLRVQAYPAAVFARLGGMSYAPGEAFVLTLPLLLVAGLLVAAERRLGHRHVVVRGLGLPRGRLPLGAWRWPLSFLIVGIVGLGLAPLIALVMRAAASGSAALPLAAFAESGSVSVVVGALGASAAVLLSLPIAHRVARRRPGAVWADAGLTLAFVTPAAVLGVGLIAVWNRPGLVVVYGSSGILVVGYVARYAVLAARPIAIAFAQSSPGLDEAAALAGASWLRRLGGIVVPAHARALVAGWAIVFVFCLRDLETSVLYYPPGMQPLTVRIFTLEANGPEAVTAALATGHVLLTATALLAASWLLRRIRWTGRS